MDSIHIKGLHANIFLGVYPEEQLKPRPISIDLSLDTDLSQACASDLLEDTIDYHSLSQNILSALAPKNNLRFQLIERVAAVILSVIFNFDRRISSATVRVSKPNAFPDSDSAEVVLHRSRPPA